MFLKRNTDAAFLSSNLKTFPSFESTGVEKVYMDKWEAFQKLESNSSYNILDRKEIESGFD